jgi:hypothetical protein
MAGLLLRRDRFDGRADAIKDAMDGLAATVNGCWV